MSQENVELLRRITESFNPGDRVAEVFWGEFDDPTFENHEVIDAGDQVLIWATLRGRGKHSGAETGWDVWGLWTVRDGRIARSQTFTDRDTALEAAGLQE